MICSEPYSEGAAQELVLCGSEKVKGALNQLCSSFHQLLCLLKAKFGKVKHFESLCGQMPGH